MTKYILVLMFIVIINISMCIGADVKVSALPSNESVTGSSEVVNNFNGTTYRSSVDSLYNNVFRYKGYVSFTITNPLPYSNVIVLRSPVACKIINGSINVLCKGGTSILGQMLAYDSNGLNPVQVDISDITAGVDVNATDDGGLSTPNISTGNYIGWRTSTVNGVVNQVIVSYEYGVQ